MKGEIEETPTLFWSIVIEQHRKEEALSIALIWMVGP